MIASFAALAFIPLYDPLPALFPHMSEWWLVLVIPLVFVISLVYKCTRTENLAELPKTTVIMTAQILIVMTIAALGLYAVFIGVTHFA